MRKVLPIAIALGLLAAATPTTGQVMSIKGTRSETFTLGTGATKLTLTNASGTLSLANGLTVSSGTVNFSGADIDGGTIDGTSLGGVSPSSGAFTTVSASGQITSTVTTGTAPLVVASTTLVANLNVDQLDGMGLTAGSNGGVAYQSSSSAVLFSAAGTTGQLLLSGGTGAPTWSGLVDGQLFVGNGSNLPIGVSLSGDGTLSNAGVLTIASGAITGAEIANDAVTAARILQGTAGQVLMSSVAPDTTWTTVSGDLTADGAGAFTIANDAVTTAKINDGDVTAALLADAVADAIVTATLSAGSEVADVVTCTLQVKDAQGNNLSGTFLVHWNIDDGDFGAGETGQAVTVSYTNGAEWQQLTAHKKAVAFTDATGKLEIDVTHTSANTLYLMTAVAGKVYSATLTFS